MKKRRGGMKSVGEIISSPGALFGINPQNLIILRRAWDAEMLSFSRFFYLEGIEKNTVVVKAINSSAANEVCLRKNEILRSLNKYFKSKWLKDIKVVCKF